MSPLIEHGPQPDEATVAYAADKIEQALASMRQLLEELKTTWKERPSRIEPADWVGHYEREEC